jgi:beta-galactosidase
VGGWLGVSDTYLLIPSHEWQKLQVWINGNNVGRSWWTGPQQTLYVPAPFLRLGVNEIIMLSEDGISSSRPNVQFVSSPVFI